MGRIIILFMMCFMSIALSGQEILDNYVNFRAEYKFLFKKDSTIMGYHSDMMHLDVCNSGHSLFYSKNSQYRDSLMNALLIEGMDTYSIMENVRNIPRGENWILDKKIAQQSFTLSKTYIDNIFNVPEKLSIPNWEIEQDTLTINGHLCQKATACIGGRIWHAWFSPKIPVNDGPWLLWGLPGLILKGEEANGYFKFECTDYGKFDNPPQIYLSLLSRPRQRSITLKDFIKADILFGEDPDTFLEIYLGVRSTYGDKAPLQKYIPLFAPDYVK